MPRPIFLSIYLVRLYVFKYRQIWPMLDTGIESRFVSFRFLGLSKPEHRRDACHRPESIQCTGFNASKALFDVILLYMKINNQKKVLENSWSAIHRCVLA